MTYLLLLTRRFVFIVVPLCDFFFGEATSATESIDKITWMPFFLFLVLRLPCFPGEAAVAGTIVIVEVEAIYLLALFPAPFSRLAVKFSNEVLPQKTPAPTLSVHPFCKIAFRT